MAQKEATLLLKVKKVGGDFLKKTESRLSSIAQKVMGYGAAIGAVGGAIAAAAVKAGRFEGVQRSFVKLAQAQGAVADTLLKDMRRLSQGTVSDLALMEQANNAALLGLPIDRMGDMMKVAMSASQATGQSMDFMLKSITTGLGRQSKMILDNLGITMNAEDANKRYAESMGIVGRQLTDAEKKQAFINEALRIGLDNAEKAGAGTLTLAQQWDKAKAQAENFTVAVGQAATPAIQFFGEQVMSVFEGMNTAASQNKLSDFFQETAKVITVVKNLFVTFGEVVGTIIGGVSNTLANAFTGRFSAAADSIGLTMETLKENLKSNAERTGEELEAIDQRFAEARVERVRQEEAAKAEVRMQAHEEKLAFDLEAFETEMQVLQERKQTEIDLIGASEIQKTDIALQGLEKRLKNEQDVHKKKKLWEQKMQLLEKKEKLVRDKFEKEEQEKKDKAEEERQKQRLANLRGTLGTISTLTQSNNKTLVAIGKAAALAQIAIEAPIGISRALASAPPPANFALAALVGVAFAAQAASVAGVALAEGGIVPATRGGIQATIGEGGRSEAVIPLPDDFDPDTGGISGNTFVFNGPILGDENQAREFAVLIDQQLLELRRANESLAFDEGII